MAPGRLLQHPVHLQDLLLSVLFLQEQHHGQRRLSTLGGLPSSPACAPLRHPEQWEVRVNPRQNLVDGLLQWLGCPWVCDDVDAHQERVLCLLHRKLTWEHTGMNEWMSGWVGRQMDGQTDGWVGRWMDRWANG